MGNCRDLIAYAKVFREGRSQDEYKRQMNRPWVPPPIGQAITHFPDHDMIVWVFPNDPGLPQLAALMDVEQVVSYFPTEVRSLIETTQRNLNKVKSKIVNYRPEVRCVIKYELHRPIDGEPLILFGKTFYNGAGKELYQRMKHFWERSLSQSGSLSVAQPLGYSEAVNTTWQRGIHGVPLVTILDEKNYQEHLERVTRGLASLHESEVPDLTTSTIGDHLREVRKKVNKLSQGAPHVSTDLHALARNLEETAPLQEEIPHRPIYWDFHINQLLACDKRVVFFDLDELVIGDPLQDVANFMVDLHFRNFDPSFVRRLISMFFLAYRQNVDWAVPVARLNWHARIQFLNKAYRHYTQQKPDWLNVLESVLAMSGQGIIPDAAKNVTESCGR